MKKTIFFIMSAAVLLAGCTSKEQDKKIHTFWQQQYTQAARKLLASNPTFWQKFLPASLTKPETTYTSSFPRRTVAATPQKRTGTPRRENVPQVLDISMEGEAFPGKAPHAERVRIKQEWASIQENNQNTLRDLQTAFGDEVKNKAFYITFETERKLKQQAMVVPNYKTYLTKQKEIIAEQEEALKKLMEQNKGSLRRVRKTAAAR